MITIGETMALVAPARAESLATAQDLRLHAGGAESNVASHLAEIGVTSAWVSAVGDDVLGRRIVRSVERHGVDIRWVSFDAAAPTGVYFKDPGRGVLYYRRGSAASRMSPATVANIPLEAAEVVHLSGITPALSESCAALVEDVVERVGGSNATSNVILSFDVNHRQALWADGVASAALSSLANRADLVFVGLDEAHALWGCDSADDVRALLPLPERLVVKDGSVGATEFTGGVSVFAPAIPTDVVEAVGAGDAFAAGYLAALLRGETALDRLRCGHERARLVLLSTSDFIGESTTTTGKA